MHQVLKRFITLNSNHSLKCLDLRVTVDANHRLQAREEMLAPDDVPLGMNLRNNIVTTSVPIPIISSKLLELNKNTKNKEELIRKKIARYYFDGEFDVSHLPTCQSLIYPRS